MNVYINLSAFVVYTNIQIGKYFVEGKMHKIQMRDFIIVNFVYLLILKLFKYEGNGETVLRLIDSTLLLL